MIPFACIVTAVRHLPASRVAVVATLEPVLGALIAWPLLGQALSPIQIGGLLVIGAVIWVQTGRQGLEAELAPGYERAQEPASPVEVRAGASGERRALLARPYGG
jgi:hypothetical protein